MAENQMSIWKSGAMQTDNIDPDGKSYGCLFVKSGDEQAVAIMLEKQFAGIEAHAITQIKHQSKNGIRSHSSVIMVPGYVIFQAQSDLQVSRLLSVASAYRILKYSDDDWHLKNNDLAFAQWVFQNQGEIGVSVVFMESDRILVIEGPLKAVQGQILRIDKRNRNALVSLGMNRQVFKVWLAFEWMDKL